jgi:hypothetical protein
MGPKIKRVQNDQHLHSTSIQQILDFHLNFAGGESEKPVFGLEPKPHPAGDRRPFGGFSSFGFFTSRKVTLPIDQPSRNLRERFLLDQTCYSGEWSCFDSARRK